MKSSISQANSGEYGRKYWAAIIFFLFVSIGLFALMRGAIEKPSLSIGWERKTLIWGAGVSVVVMSILALASRVAKLGVLGLLLICMVAALAGIGPTCAVMLILLASHRLGFEVLPCDGREVCCRSTQTLLQISVGLVLVSFFFAVVARLPIHYTWSYVAVLSSCVLIKSRAWREKVVQGLRAHMGKEAPVMGAWEALLFGLILTATLVKFLANLLPEIGADALAMHLAMPAAVATSHSWNPAAAGFLWGWIPLACDWLYTTAFMLGGEQAARLYNFSADVLTALLVGFVAGNLAGKKAGYIAACVYTCNPMTYLLTSSLFVENTWTLWCFSAVVLASRLTGEKSQVRDWLATGVALAGALSAKVITVFWFPLFVVPFLVAKPVSLSRVTSRLAAVSLPVITIGAMPFIIAFIETGNPVFPFMNAIFKSPYYYKDASFDNPNFHSNLSWNSIYEITFQSQRYLEASPGAFGVVWVVFLAASYAFVLIRGTMWMRAVAIFSLLFTYLVFREQAYLRYIAPVYPIWAIGVAFSVVQVTSGLISRTVLIGLTGILDLANLGLYSNSTWGYRSLPIAEIGDVGARLHWRDNLVPERKIGDVLSQLDESRVLWLGRATYGGVTQHVAGNDWHNPQIQRALDSDVTSTVKSVLSSYDYVVMTPEYDSCGKQHMCALLSELGAPKLSFGGAKLYAIPSEWRFVHELLVDHDLNGIGGAWHGGVEWRRSSGSAIATLESPITQTVAVTAGHQYLYQTKMRCLDTPSEVRVQVNWMESNRQFIESTIVVERCAADWKDFSSIMIAPSRAAWATIYGTAHTPRTRVELDYVDFKSIR